MDYSTLSDETLILLIARAQPDSLRELYQRYNRLVFSLALNMVNERETAEEITLDVFTRVWERAETYRASRAKVSTWLINITRYQAIDVLRRQAVRPEKRSVSWSEVEPNPGPAEDTPEEATELSLRRARVRAALAQLPADQKEALALAYFKGYTHRQIAEVLDQPLGTIKTRIRSALQKLRQLLQDEQPDD